MKYDLIVIGGGVSGMTAAICAAERGKKVLILEKGDRVGRKLLATGNGKCNLANTASTVGRYNTRFVDEILAEYPLGAQSEFFLGLGLLTREKAGRIYPYSEQASTVLNVMRAALDRYGVEVLTSVGAERAEGHYTVNGKYHAENLLIATGSDASFGYESLSLVYPYGHSSTRRIPSLVPLITDKTNLKGLKGIRARVKAVLCEGEREISSVSDEIIFKDNGVSGTAIFGLSSALARHALINGEAEIKIDFAPDLTHDELKSLFSQGIALEGMFHKEIAAAVRRYAESEKLSNEEAVKSYVLKDVRPGSRELAQVMCGGLVTDDFYSDTLESRLSEGLYASGEALDVDGDCGGFNLMWAVASGMAAGKACGSK